MNTPASFLHELVGSMSQGAAGNPTVAMIEAAFAHHGLPWRYINMEVAPGDLGDAVRGAKAMGFRGFNCSLPHKVAVRLNLDVSTLQPGMVAADAIGNPPRTRFIRDAEARGCRALDGLGMLVNQGIGAVQYWTGIEPDAAVMRRTLQRALGL